MAIKGQALTVSITAITASTGVRKTGDAANISVYLVKDGVAAARNDATAISEVDATNAPGEYKVVLDATDMTASTIVVTGKSATSGIEIIPVKIVTELGRIDAAISTRSSHSAADVKSVMEVAGSSLASIITHLVEIKGGEWSTENLVSIKSFIDSIYAKTTNLPGDPASNTQVNTRLAASGYTAPDNAGITDIQDRIPAALVDGKMDSNASVDEQAIADAVIAGINTQGDGKVLLTDTIEYPSGTPLAGITVTVCTDSSGLVKQESDITDSLGIFSFYLTPGTYYLSIQHPGFYNQLIEKVVAA